MIAPLAIQELLDRTPFESFLIRMNDGQQYEVVNPSLAVAMQTVLFVAAPARDRFKLLPYQNVTSVESQSQVEYRRLQRHQRADVRLSLTSAFR